MYQLFLTDHDFWRASNSLQLDETIGIYAATLQQPAAPGAAQQQAPAGAHEHVALRAGFRLVLHGLSTEMLHCLLMEMKDAQEAARATARAAAF